MSLKEAYTMAHSAQCRLQLAASRPERNLRFVVGHLMHYESLRLRIVEIEHDISKSARAKAVQFQGTGHVSRQNSTGQRSGRRSPPPSRLDDDTDDDDDDDEIEADDDDDEEADDDENGLGLQRFPSGSARPPRPPPDLEEDLGEDDEDDDEPTSPEEPDPATLEQVLKSTGDANMTKSYECARKCPCHGKTDSPSFENLWILPASQSDKPGVTRAVAQVSA